MEIVPIPGFEDYGATHDGRIFSRKRGAWRELALHPKGKGGDYLKVKLYTAPYEYTQIAVHELIAITFIGPKPIAPVGTHMEVNHKDLNKRNNNDSNLEWLTHLGNVDHALKAHGHRGLRSAEEHMVEMLRSVLCIARREHPKQLSGIYRGRARRGMEIPHKLTDKYVREIRARARRQSLGSLAKSYGVSKNTVWCIVHRMKWKHIT